MLLRYPDLVCGVPRVFFVFNKVKKYLRFGKTRLKDIFLFEFAPTWWCGVPRRTATIILLQYLLQLL